MRTFRSVRMRTLLAKFGPARYVTQRVAFNGWFFGKLKDRVVTLHHYPSGVGNPRGTYGQLGYHVTDVDGWIVLTKPVTGYDEGITIVGLYGPHTLDIRKLK